MVAEDTWTWNASLESANISVEGVSVGFSSLGGTYAIGYSDGTITMHPTENVTPVISFQSADGIIRDMLTTATGDLIIVTTTGLVQRLAFCDDCVNDASLSKVAAARLARARILGLTSVALSRTADADTDLIGLSS